MENNTVTISLEMYNSLRDFKKLIESNSIEKCLISGFQRVYSNSEMVNKLQKEIDNLNYKLSCEKNDKEKDLNDKIKNMGVMDFIKLKLSL
jgi:hypothetical protein